MSPHLLSLFFSVLASLSGGLSLCDVSGGPWQLLASLLPTQKSPWKEGATFSMVCSNVMGLSLLGHLWSYSLGPRGSSAHPAWGWKSTGHIVLPK